MPRLPPLGGGGEGAGAACGGNATWRAAHYCQHSCQHAARPPLKEYDGVRCCRNAVISPELSAAAASAKWTSSSSSSNGHNPANASAEEVVTPLRVMMGTVRVDRVLRTPGPCSYCHDFPSDWMAAHGKTCSGWLWALKLRGGMRSATCTDNAEWRVSHYCQYTCWKAGEGYPGANNCCEGAAVEPCRGCHKSAVSLVHRRRQETRGKRKVKYV